MKKTLLSIIFLLSILTVKSQDNLVVTIDGSVGELRATSSKSVPVFCSNNWAISQQFYFAEEICKANGTIESIAFKTAEVTEESEKYPFTRNLIVYIINTEDYAVSGNIMKRMSESDQVFSGEVEFSYNSWVTIDIEDFEYTGKNILICVNDISGTNVSGGVTFDAFVGPIMVGENNGYRALYKRSISGGFDATTTISGASTILDTPVPCVRLTFKEGSTEEYLDPAQPTNFTATVLNESEVLLEWTGDENTSSYDICENAEVIANTTETSFIVKNLSLDWHCFKIIGVNGIKRSEPSEIQCVELIKGPEESIEELTSSLLLYPNPVNDKLYIETQTLTQTLTIEIYDIYGRCQVTETPSHQACLVVDVTDLKSGVYFVKVVTSEGEAVRRIIKD